MNDLNKYRLSLQGAAIDQRLLAVPGKADQTDLDALALQVVNKQDVITDLDTIRSGAAAGATAYQKPAGGIPSSDMTTAVQTSLGKADTAYQKPSGGIPSSDMTTTVQSALTSASTAYQKPAGGIPSSDMTNAVQTSLGKADSAYQLPSGGIPKSTLASGVQTSLGKADTAYQKPGTGIPKTDLASAVQTSLGKADTAYQKPSGGIPSSDMTNAVQTSLGKADTAYQKPGTGIPASDLASGVIPDVSNFITNSVNDLVNYYLKTETYSQAEVNALIAGMSGFSYEIYADLSDITDPASNILYLIGPTGSGSDQYEEYVYPDALSGFTKIGDTSIDLSDYVTTTDLSTALASYVTSSDLATTLASYVTSSDLATTLAGYATTGDIASMVTGPASSTDSHVAVFDGATGKVIKDGTYTIATSVPSGAVFTDHITTATDSGTGTVVTGVSADANGALTITKGNVDLSGYATTTALSTAVESMTTAEIDAILV